MYANSFKTYIGDEWKKECFPIPHDHIKLYPEYEFPGFQYFDDFTFNGEEYYINSVVKLSEDAKRFLGLQNEYTQIVQHEITNLGKERWGYVADIWDDVITNAFTTVPPDQLVEEVVIPADLEQVEDKLQYYKDYEVPGVITGWIIYIVIMVGSLIFVDFGIIWGFASLAFFAWRHQKLKKPKRHNYGFNKW